MVWKEYDWVGGIEWGGGVRSNSDKMMNYNIILIGMLDSII